MAVTSELPSYTLDSAADWSLIPPHMIGGLRRYIEHGIPPGSFLTAVLCNDLREACSRADDENRDRLFQYVRFFYNYAPSECWGSPAKFDAWCKQGGLSANDESDQAGTTLAIAARMARRDMSAINQKIDEALKLLDEMDATPLSEISRKLDKITEAIIAAKVALIVQERDASDLARYAK